MKAPSGSETGANEGLIAEKSNGKKKHPRKNKGKAYGKGDNGKK